MLINVDCTIINKLWNINIFKSIGYRFKIYKMHFNMVIHFNFICNNKMIRVIITLKSVLIRNM